jgi:hypothetical protein
MMPDAKKNSRHYPDFLTGNYGLAKPVGRVNGALAS